LHPGPPRCTLRSPTALSETLGRASRGHLFAGAGVVAAAVVLVSVLTWWNGMKTPMSYPMEAVERVLPAGVAEQVEEQAVTLMEGSTEALRSSVRSVSEGLAGAGLGIGRLTNSAAVSSSGSLVPSLSSVLPTPSSSTSATLGTSEEPSVPVAAQEPSFPTTSEPTTSSPPATEEPQPPPAAEEPPPSEEPLPSEEPPPSEQPQPPPAAEEPPPPAPEEPRLPPVT
jgi:hypothetical protein